MDYKIVIIVLVDCWFNRSDYGKVYQAINGGKIKTSENYCSARNWEYWDF